uniref:Uncharacterized protein n=1 Tax=Amphimedon queenslandica TaxID=400682 RepID=A0A1X7TLL8_AMPQE
MILGRSFDLKESIDILIASSNSSCRSRSLVAKSKSLPERPPVPRMYK